MVVGVNARLLYSSHLEGVARYIFETTCEMAKKHPEDTFILYFDRKIESDFVYPDNVLIKIVYLPTRHPILWKIWFNWLLPFRFKLDKIDVFYSGDGFISMGTNVPQVMVTHDLAYLHYPEQISKPSLEFYKKYLHLFHQTASKIIAVSEYTRKDIASKYHMSDKKISVAFNGVRETTINNDNLRPEFKSQVPIDKGYFCYVGALHPRKNIVVLCKAFEQFKKKSNHSCKLLIAGRLAWHTNEIQDAFSKHKDIIYLGPINEDEKYYLLQNSIGLAYISLFEGFGIPILEAFRMGTGVITSHVSSMPEVAGDAAILVDPNDLEEISEGFKTLLNNEIRNQLILNGKNRLKLFSWEKSANIIYTEIKEAYNQRTVRNF